MPGMTIPLFNKRSFSFDNGSSTVLAVKAVDVSQYTEGALLVRVHSRDIVGSSGKIEVIAKTTAPSNEDPSQDFVYDTAVATAEVEYGDTGGYLVREALSDDFGGALEITVVGTKDSGDCNAELSADLVVKS